MLIFKFGITVIVLATALSTAAYAAKGGGGGHAGGGGGHAAGGGGGHVGGGGGGAHIGGGGAHFGGGGASHFSARPAISRSAAAPSSRGTVSRGTASRGSGSAASHSPASNSVGQRTLFDSTGNATHNARDNPNLKSNAVRSTLNSPAVSGALRNRSALRNPGSRAHITASAATAGWHNGRDGGNGWWRHGNGGYGWVGPLYWPFAYYDMYDYAMWGYGYDDSFWGYGYGDIYAGIFAPYGYDDLAGYLPQYASSNPSEMAPPPGAPAAVSDQLTQMCGADSRDIAGLPIDQFQQTIQPTAEQSAALDDLANASLKAAQDLKAACPTDIALTAPSRLAAMQQRIEAMIAAVQTVQPSLEKFYGLLSDEQKARLTALGNDQRHSKTTDDTAGSLGQNCDAAQPGVMEWPTAQIDQSVRPTDAQGASLVALQNATTQAADLLKTSCVASDPLTPPARLAAVGRRLATMLQAVTMVSSALNDFYGTLSDEQKARFEAIGPQRTSQLESLEVAPTEAPRHRRGIPNAEQVIRRLLSL
jgi:hypothetical protein